MEAPWHEVFVGEGTFGLLDAGEIPVHSADWSNGLIAPMLQGGALVRTGIHTGDVRVCVQAQQEPATEIDTSRPWEEVVEASVAAPRDHLQLESLDFGPPDPNGPLTGRGSTHYRVRVHARGRETAWDKTAETPTEEYLLFMWPSEPAPTQTLRSSTRLEQQQQSEADNTDAERGRPREGKVFLADPALLAKVVSTNGLDLQLGSSIRARLKQADPAADEDKVLFTVP